MGQRDISPPTPYIDDVEALLDEALALTLPEDALQHAVRRTFAKGFDPREAAVLICHEHSRRLGRHLVEQGERASDLVELAIAHRIDGCAELAGQMNHDVMDLLPDLPNFVRQACFSNEFRDMVTHIATWHGIPTHRWSAPDAHAESVVARALDA